MITDIQVFNYKKRVDFIGRSIKNSLFKVFYFVVILSVSSKTLSSHRSHYFIFTIPFFHKFVWQTNREPNTTEICKYFERNQF